MLQLIPEISTKNYTIYHSMLLGCFFSLFLSWIVREQSLPFSLLSVCAQSQAENISTEFCFGLLLCRLHAVCGNCIYEHQLFYFM